MKNFVSCAYKATVGGASVAITTALGFAGFYLNGSAGGTTLTISDGTTAIMSTSAAASTVITVIPCQTIRFLTSISAACSGTGSYTVFFKP